MTRDEWVGLVPTVCLRWVELDEADVLDWYDLLDDLEGGHVTAALVTLGQGGNGATPTVSVLRHATAREEVAAMEPVSTGPFLSLTQWRAMGCPGLPSPYTPDDVARWLPQIEGLVDGAA
jgi:hypothetical protein